MPLPRPYIPLYIREMALDHQMGEAGFKPSWASQQGRSVATRLRLKLEEFFGCVPVELHHRPALINRNYSNAGYWPDANDPVYLVYLPTGEHDIETRVRGQHGDYSDLAKARKRKRKERLTRKQVVADWYTVAPRYRTKERLTKMLAEHGLLYRPPFKKRKWPSRPLRGRKALANEHKS